MPTLTGRHQTTSIHERSSAGQREELVRRWGDHETPFGSCQNDVILARMTRSHLKPSDFFRTDSKLCFDYALWRISLGSLDTEDKSVNISDGAALTCWF
jgi:hypothetical protein